MRNIELVYIIDTYTYNILRLSVSVDFTHDTLKFHITGYVTSRKTRKRNEHLNYVFRSQYTA